MRFKLKAKCKCEGVYYFPTSADSLQIHGDKKEILNTSSDFLTMFQLKAGIGQFSWKLNSLPFLHC